MARRSLKPQLNQIRTWVRQGRTDAWIAHQLEVSVKEIDSFKREHELVPADAPEGADAEAGPRLDEEPDLRAEDDALVAAALDAEPDEEEADESDDADEDGDADAAKDDDGQARKRRRGRRGGRGRRTGGRSGKQLEGTFDHGEEGYGLWLDPAIQDNPVYAEHWAGHRPVVVSVEPDRIVLERAGEESNGAAPEEGDAGSEPAGPSSLDPDQFDA